ncbi:MAG TPA: hypothetical protein VGB38_06795 [bacterium]
MLPASSLFSQNTIGSNCEPVGLLKIVQLVLSQMESVRATGADQGCAKPMLQVLPVMNTQIHMNNVFPKMLSRLMDSLSSLFR